jgi:RNA polymerase primary sigma factor
MFATLQPYLEPLGATPLLGAEQEHAAAEELWRLRQQLWTHALGYLPWADAIGDLLPTVVRKGPEALGEFDAYRHAAAMLRRNETRENQDRWSGALDRLASVLVQLDPACKACDLILADISSAENRQREGMRLKVRALPPSGAGAFRRFATRVRAASSSLHMKKTAFVKANLRLVVSIVPRYSRGRVPLSDALQDGNGGLMRAVDSFDPARGTRFSTYAAWWIRHSVTRAISDRSRLVRQPVHMSDAVRRVSGVRKQHVAANGREPSQDELAELTGIPARKLERMNRFLLNEGPRLDAPVPGLDGLLNIDQLRDSSPGVDEEMEREAALEVAAELLDDLRPMELGILRRRFGFDGSAPCSLREIGEEYGLSRERIRQIQERAIGRLREGMAERGMV